MSSKKTSLVLGLPFGADVVNGNTESGAKVWTAMRDNTQKLSSAIGPDGDPADYAIFEAMAQAFQAPEMEFMNDAATLRSFPLWDVLVKKVGELKSKLTDETQDYPVGDSAACLEAIAGLEEVFTTTDSLVAESYDVATLTITVMGKGTDVKAAISQLKAATDPLGFALQRELAEKYGWEAGKTSCCEINGFNPPAEIADELIGDALPVLPVHNYPHDAPTRSSALSGLAGLLGGGGGLSGGLGGLGGLGSLLSGLGNVRVLDLNDLGNLGDDKGDFGDDELDLDFGGDENPSVGGGS